MKWTAELLTDDGHYLRYEVRARAARVAVVEVENSDEGRLTVARMVAALQMEEALMSLQDPEGHIWHGPHQPPCTGECRLVRAALEAAKRLP